MSKRLSPHLIVPFRPQDNMVHQFYQNTNMKLYTRGRHMREGETRTFDLTMVEDYESFEGHEVARATYTRNPKLYRGKYLNVHRDKQGHYQVHFLRMELTKRMNPERVSKAIGRELRTAKRMLGL